MAGSNLVEPGDKVLVVNTGYFGDRFGVLLERYGAQVSHVRAPVGGCPSEQAADDALAGGGFKLMTITRVDTSTGVLAGVEALAAIARRRGVLCMVDNVPRRELLGDIEMR